MDEKINQRKFEDSDIFYIIRNRLNGNNITRKNDKKIVISDWKSPAARSQDLNAENECVESLLKIEENSRQGDTTKRDKHKQIALNLSLAAKNRAEDLSATSDFYPVGLTVVVLAFATFSAFFDLTNEKYLKLITAFAVVFIAFVYANSRQKTRRQVADLKIIANILDATEKRIK